jgi:dihydrofolate reductase
MRKLIESTFVTLDGIIADTIPSTAPAAAPEKWGAPYWDNEHYQYSHDLLFASEALLLGRVTYDGFVASWPARTGDFADKINGMPKFVASRTLSEPLDWNATLLQGDIAAEVGRLKQEPGGSILKYGTGELDRLLLQHNLVDEYHFWIFPVVVGSGQRLFNGVDIAHLKLVETARFASGITVLTYSGKQLS